jgi:secreted PhoX family phosphatase
MSHEFKPFQSLLAQRFSRRDVLQAGIALAPLALSGCAPRTSAPSAGSRLGFQPIKGSAADAVILPPGYTYDLLVRWGDSLFEGVPDLDAARLADGVLLEKGAGELQSKQFGQNCDAIHFFALDARGDRGILCVNNEFTDDALMYPGHAGFAGASRGAGRAYVEAHPQIVAVSQAAQGVSIIEIVRERGAWRRVKNSRYARRITATTPIDIGGPARGAALMRTAADPNGTRALGTFANCAGGRTPWGTYLTAEENFQDYFGNYALLQQQRGADDPVVLAHACYGMWSTHSLYGWEAADSRFDLIQNPTEPLRFGWIVEIDPMDPTRPPVKRTALGRFAHECASTFVAPDGRVAVYMGDDAKFEYVYKFVTAERFDPKNPAANRDLLDKGTLYVARFDANGSGEWLPLVYDEKGPLNAAAGFRDQAEVLIKARAAAWLLGATPMDRPEESRSTRSRDASTSRVRTTTAARLNPRSLTTAAARSTSVRTPPIRVRSIVTATSSRFARPATITPRRPFPGRSSCSAAIRATAS